MEGNLLSPDQRILIVGDGDLSFSSSLIEHCGHGQNLFATVYDSQDVVCAKYGPELVGARLDLLRRHAGGIACGVDATKLQRDVSAAFALAGSDSGLPKFDRIVFMFPWDASCRSQEDWRIVLDTVGDRKPSGRSMKKLHLRLILLFLWECEPLLSRGNGRGLVLISVNPTFQADWNIDGLIPQFCEQMSFHGRLPFSLDSIAGPGYTYKSTSRDHTPCAKGVIEPYMCVFGIAEEEVHVPVSGEMSLQHVCYCNVCRREWTAAHGKTKRHRENMILDRDWSELATRLRADRLFATSGR